MTKDLNARVTMGGTHTGSSDGGEGGLRPDKDRKCPRSEEFSLAQSSVTSNVDGNNIQSKQDKLEPKEWG